MVLTGDTYFRSGHMDTEYREGWHHEDGKGTEFYEKNVLKRGSKIVRAC